MKKSWLLAVLLTAPALAAELESFTPLGATTSVRQVRATFSAPMAPLGKADAPAPFVVECQPGQGYWADERTWVYDLTTNLPPATACKFRPVAGLKTLAGEAVSGEPEYAFQLAAPKIEYVMPEVGSQIDESQAFVIALDGAMSPAEVVAAGHCAIQGIHERIPLKRLEGAERQNILKHPESGYQLDGVSPERLEVVQCARPLPANAKISLVWRDESALNFEVRDHFVARMRCTRENTRAGCIPIQPVRVQFSAPVARADLDRVVLKDASGKTYRQTKESARFDNRVSFPGPFPANAKLTVTLPAGLKDDAGRALINQDRFPLAVSIGEIPPLVKFSGDFGIIERQAGGLLPITLRNLEAGPEGTAAKVRWLRLSKDADIAAWWKRLYDFDHPQTYPQPDRRRERLLDAKTPGLVERTLPKPNGAKEFEVVGLPLEKPGYYVLEAESRRLGQALLGADQPMYVRAAALVTNLAVHFKWGPKSSLAWVTSLDKGKPVAQASVAVSDCKGKVLAKGVTDARGMSMIPTGLPDPRAADYECPLLVSARSGDDLSFARSDWDEGIETWRFDLPSDWRVDDRLASSVLARTLLKPGETVHMKHLLRDKRMLGLGYPAKQPATLQIEHEESGHRWFLPLVWKKGAAYTHWKIPVTSKRGGYALRLIDKAILPDTPPEQLQYLEGLDTGHFTVADFRVPLMKASLNPVRPDLVAAGNAEFDVSVAYLGGGAAKNLPVKLRGQMSPRYGLDFDAWKGYDFAEAIDDNELGGDMALSADTLKLDAGGAGRGRLTGIPARKYPQRIVAELEYTDPNGEIQTVSRRLDWWPAAVAIGLKRPEWVLADRATPLEFVVVDHAGKPVAEAPVIAKPVMRRNLSHRIRLAGGFYGYREETEDIPLAGQCEGKTNAKGRFTCSVTGDADGEIVVTAETRDNTGRVATTSASYWVSGKDDWWFKQQNHDRIDLIPEKRTYVPGEKARFQVRMPFRDAAALVTVERDGILDARLVTLSGKTPVIELPIQPTWAPNVFVSALVVRGRVSDVAPTALVDLGKPAYKLGIANINIDQRGHRFEVKVTADRDSYQTREKAKIKLAVKTADGKALPRDTEVILAAVDEGLLELADNDSWNLLPAMMVERGYSMRTFTAQMQVTGKRHFGKKALPPGGGGGRSATRELFDTLLYWNPKVKLNNKGEATVEVPLNDSLTRFRIVAVASSEARFGTGWTGIRATRDLRIDSGLAPVVREGDRLQARFTVRNGTNRTMKIAMGAQVGIPGSGNLAALDSKQFELEPGDGKEVGWTVTIPKGADSLPWTVNAREVGGSAQDMIKVAQAVQPAVPVRLVAGQLYRLDKPLDLPVAPPTDAVPDQGELRATLAATLGDGLSGVREYMRRYPYSCLEQKTSKAIATHDTKAWGELAEALPGYLDGNGLAAFFPGMQEGNIALTAYVLSASREAGYALPAQARTSMETALENYLAGRLTMVRTPTDLADTAQRLAALAALARAGKASAELAATIEPAPKRWPTSLLIDWIDVLKRSPALPGRDAQLKAAQTALRGKLTYSGSRLNFGDESLWWQMTSGDTDALRGLAAVIDLPEWRDDLPKLVAGTLARQSRGHWDTTTANAWGTLALNKYSRQFETLKPSGLSTAFIGETGRQVDWKAFPSGATASFPLPAKAETLKLRHTGAGAPYVSLTTLAAVDLKQPIARGYSIRKELIPIEQKTAGKWSRGDIVRARLTVEARDDMGWVVVDDPVPAGASLLGGGLKRDSSLLTVGERQEGVVWPAWQERRFDRFQSYYEYVPRGKFSLEYTLRLNTDGAFNLPPTRVEAMYAPEMYGESPNADFVVAP
jgi:uncharacterized protein YfaS (alpha-2-macroglobulin family)